MIFLFFLIAALFGCSIDGQSVSESAKDTPTSTTVPIVITDTENTVYPPIPNVFMNRMKTDTVITFDSKTESADIYLCVASSPKEEPAYVKQNTLTLSSVGQNFIYGYAMKSGTAKSPLFEMTVFVSQDFAECDDFKTQYHKSEIRHWASGYENYRVGANCDSSWQTPDKALGEAKGDSFDIVCLGDGGEITLTFDCFVSDGPGCDFAVFENSYDGKFLELGYVEVSSNGVDFIRFDNMSLTDETVDAFGKTQARNINNLAGKYKQGYGAGFDLAELKYRIEVLDGTVCLNKITHIKIIDIDSGTFNADSFGSRIYDPYTAVGDKVTSSGFDLDAIGVINWTAKQ